MTLSSFASLFAMTRLWSMKGSYSWNKLQFIDSSFRWSPKNAVTLRKLQKLTRRVCPTYLEPYFSQSSVSSKCVIRSKDGFTAGGIKPRNARCYQKYHLPGPFRAYAKNSHGRIYIVGHLCVLFLRKAVRATFNSTACLCIVPSKGADSSVWADLLWPQTDQE